LYFHGRYFGISRTEARRRARDLLERFHLEDKSSVDVDALSGGLAQRVQIARALLHAPDILFLDEPTAGLDPQTRVMLWEQLQDLNRGGQTILLTTHYMEEADRLCHRIAIMDHGQVLALDTPRSLKQQVGADRLITLSLSAPDDGTVRQTLAAIPGVINASSEGRTVRVEAGSVPGLVGQVVNATISSGFELTDLAVAEPSLEAVFLKLTGTEYRE
jgi:ABC-2 type transport system ATP-binding protein